MRKQELYDFIETKLSRTRNGLSKQLNDLYEIIKEAAKEEFTGLANITRQLVNVTDAMEKVKQDHHEILKDNWSTTSAIRNCNSALSFQDDTIFKLSQVAKYNLENGTNTVLLGSKYPRLLTVVNEHRKVYEYLNDKIRDVETLELELKGVIKGSRSGKDAYKNLVALNVNMSGFEDAQATLPAVQKLSVDVCVINEDCNS